MGLFKPDLILDSITDLTIDIIISRGIFGIILDADNTLLAYNSLNPEEASLNWIESLKSHGIKIVIVSNNFNKRVSQISNKLDLPYISMALKPMPFKLYKAVKLMGLAKDQVYVVGDQLFTDVLGARLAGLKVVLVKPISSHDSFITRFLRKIEKIILESQMKRSK